MRYAKKPLSKTAVVFVFSQFPMGKVKAKSTTTTGSNVPVYQFPIGKVKVGRRLKRCARSLYVSIPYGKGKGKAKASFAMAAAAYQFPMGKVKLYSAEFL